MNELKLKESVVMENVKNFVVSDELQFKFYCPETYVVTDKETLQDAEKNQKIAKAELKRILELTSDKKKFLDDVKKVILDYEKEVEKKSKDAVAFFENSIQDYKQKEFEKQQTINRLCNEIQKMKSTIINQIESLHAIQAANVVKMQGLVQKWEIEKSEIPLEEKEEILETVEMQIEATPIIPEIVHEEKNFVNTNAIQKKESYSIRDEQAFIEYAKENKLWHLLDIKPSKSGFNLWVKEPGNKNKPFVLITVTNK